MSSFKRKTRRRLNDRPSLGSSVFEMESREGLPRWKKIVASSNGREDTFWKVSHDTFMFRSLILSSIGFMRCFFWSTAFKSTAKLLLQNVMEMVARNAFKSKSNDHSPSSSYFLLFSFVHLLHILFQVTRWWYQVKMKVVQELFTLNSSTFWKRGWKKGGERRKKCLRTHFVFINCFSFPSSSLSFFLSHQRSTLEEAVTCISPLFTAFSRLDSFLPFNLYLHAYIGWERQV